jgi:hypothetical protein
LIFLVFDKLTCTGVFGKVSLQTEKKERKRGRKKERTELFGISKHTCVTVVEMEF